LEVILAIHYNYNQYKPRTLAIIRKQRRFGNYSKTNESFYSAVFDLFFETPITLSGTTDEFNWAISRAESIILQLYTSGHGQR